MTAALPRVVVGGLGPAGPGLITAATAEAIARIPHRFLRTVRHPSAPAAGEARSFDHVYEAATTVDDAYAGIVEEVVAAAGEHGEVLYLVPGSPSVAERTVSLLAADPRVGVAVLPAVSFLDLAWARLGVDPLAAGARLVDGHRFAVEAAGERGPLLVGQCDSAFVLSEIKLAVEDGPASVVVLQRLGLPDEEVVEVAWDELDRAVAPDHLTSLWIPALAAPVGQELARVGELVRTLRQRCPWDREQTHQSLTRHLVEETYETLEAIEGLDREDGPARLEEELGDLLLQVFFHATLAGEAGLFTMADVARGIHDKLVHRHPHVFGTVEVESAGHVMANWERIKQAEKGRASTMDGIPAALPSLLYAHKVQRKAAAVGLDPGALAATPPGGGDHDLGAALFAAVAAAPGHGVDPEAALRATAGRFRDRFMAMERLAAARGLDLGALEPAVVEALWQEVGEQR